MADVTFLSASVDAQLFTKLRPVCVTGAKSESRPFLILYFAYLATAVIT